VQLKGSENLLDMGGHSMQGAAGRLVSPTSSLGTSVDFTVVDADAQTKRSRFLDSHFNDRFTMASIPNDVGIGIVNLPNQR
jgi:hypothetical protein